MVIIGLKNVKDDRILRENLSEGPEASEYLLQQKPQLRAWLEAITIHALCENRKPHRMQHKLNEKARIPLRFSVALTNYKEGLTDRVEDFENAFLNVRLQRLGEPFLRIAAERHVVGKRLSQQREADKIWCLLPFDQALRLLDLCRQLMPNDRGDMFRQAIRLLLVLHHRLQQSVGHIVLDHVIQLDRQATIDNLQDMLVDGHIDTLVRVRLRIFANDLVQVLAEEETEHVGKFAI